MSGEAGVVPQSSPRAPRSIPDRVLGALGVGMMILGLVVLIGGGEEDGVGRPLAAPPAVALVEPTAGATLPGPLVLVFETEEELMPQPAGWGAGGFHLHLQLDDLELMPATADIEPLGSGRYRWTVGRLEPGPHRLRLFWSDAEHRPVEAGASAVVEVEAPGSGR